ncbi:hypothetical protein [Archangium violaceum]|uniref:Uncharacterized protein n=1 Tax=Archangium violaceum Cb vi76 TaxID=1406225 RepID=A0A084T160_9BACT|nr:hypothetical protein [Archangium violaceum]KFA94445.1 hypothetical protein Q664_02675 [Archangium violaceum Cb vi76]
MSLSEKDVFARLKENAFHVLGLRPSCTRMEVEREGQKLLAMLELGLSEAAHYDTPVGRMPRTAELVRASMATLRDPTTRLQHALWAQLPPGTPAAQVPAKEEPASWPEAPVRLGWRRPG